MCYAQKTTRPISNAATELTKLNTVLTQNHFKFTPAVKKAYLNYGFVFCKEKTGLQINQATWNWFSQNPDIMQATLAAAYPIDPKILINFQRLALPINKNKVRIWKQLILAYAIRYRSTHLEIDRLEDWDPVGLMKLVTQSGNFPWQTDDMLPKLTEEEELFTKWLTGPQNLTDKRPKQRIYDLMNIAVHEINVVGEGRFRLTKFPQWDNVALAGKLFPLYLDGTPTHQRSLALKIWRWENNINKNKADFDMAKGEWPILMYLADLDPIDESQFIWDYYLRHKVIPPMGMGAVLVQGGREAEILKRTPANRPVYYKESNWHPKKFIRVYNTAKKDQGGKGYAFAKRATCTPASAVGAPPNGIFYFTGTPNNYGTYFQCAIQEDLAKVDNFLRVETVDLNYPHNGSQTVVYDQMGLAVTLSQGLEAFEDSRMALHLSKTIPSLTHEQRISLLESAVIINPLNADVLYSLAALYREKKDYDATTRLLVAVRRYYGAVLGKPVSSGAYRKGISDAKKILTGDPFVNTSVAPKIPLKMLNAQYKDNFGWIHHVCAEIILANFSVRPSNKESLMRNYQALKAELDYQLKCCGEGGKSSPIERRTKALRRLVNQYKHDSK